MATTTIPQYARTTDPTVIETLQRNDAGYREFSQKAAAFATEHGDGRYLASSFGGSHFVVGIGAEDKPTTGRWKKGPRGKGWAPFERSELAKQMEAIRFVEEPVPGLPSLVYGPFTSRGQQAGAGARFVHEGVAYFGVGFVPDADQDEEVVGTADWQEIRTSEFYAAFEAVKDARAAAAKASAATDDDAEADRAA